MTCRPVCNERGAAALELALLLPVLLAIVGMVTVTGFRMVYVGLAENEARTMARTAGLRTGLSQASPYPDDTAANRLALCGAGALALPGAAYNASADCTIVKQPNSATPIEGDVVEVTLTYRLTVIQGLAGWLPAGIVNGLSVVKASASVLRE